MSVLRSGRVAAVDADAISVILDAQEGCGGCACARGAPQTLRVPPAGASPLPGSRVEIALPPAAGEALRVLGIPLLAALAAAALATFCFPLQAPAPAVAAAAALCLAGGRAWFAQRGNLSAAIVSQEATPQHDSVGVHSSSVHSTRVHSS